MKSLSLVRRKTVEIAAAMLAVSVLAAGCTGSVSNPDGRTTSQPTGESGSAGENPDSNRQSPDGEDHHGEEHHEIDPRTHDDFTIHCDGSHAGHAHPDNAAKQSEHSALLALLPNADDPEVVVAVQDGSWFAESTWSTGSVPGDGSRVHIPCGRSVWYDGVSEARVDRIGVLGALHFAVDKNTKLVTDTLLTGPNSVFTMGLDTAPVQDGVRAQIIIHQDNGPISSALDPTLLTKGVVTHGTVRITGQPKSAFVYTAGVSAGDDVLALDSEPSGWKVGDKLVIAAAHNVLTRSNPKVMDSYRDEVVRIASIEAQTFGYRIKLDRALRYDHRPPTHQADVTLRVPIANYTRNVFIGTETDGDRYLDDGKTVASARRGHVMFMHNRDVAVRNAEFFELGRTDKAQFFSATNVAGRYALHFHRTGASSDNAPALAEGNAVWGSPGWGIVHHDAHLDVLRNAVFGVVGSGIVAEAGNETGFWDDNIVIQTTGLVVFGFNGESQSDDRGDAVNRARLENDTFFQGEAFGMKSRLLKLNGNVAVSANGAGFSFWPHGTHGPSHIDADPSDFLQAQGYDPYQATPVSPGRVATRDFRDNVCIASRHCLNTSAAKLAHRSDLDILIEDLLAWNVDQPIVSFYQENYIIKDCVFIRGVANADGFYYDAVSRDYSKREAKQRGAPFDLSSATHIHDATDFKLINNYFEGFDVILQEPLQFVLGNTVVDSTVSEVRGVTGLYREGYNQGDNESYDLIDNSPNWTRNLPNLLGTLQASIDMQASDFDMEETFSSTVVMVDKTDSAGTRKGMPMGLPVRAKEFRIDQPADIWPAVVGRDGYYQQPNGDIYMVIHIVVADRITSTVGQIPVAIRLSFLDAPPAEAFNNGPLPAGLADDRVGEFEIVDRREIGKVGNQL